MGREHPSTLTREQVAHAEAMLELSDNLAALRNKLCPAEMTSTAFWQVREESVVKRSFVCCADVSLRLFVWYPLTCPHIRTHLSVV